jgi:hypothetical protein
MNSAPATGTKVSPRCRLRKHQRLGAQDSPGLFVTF